MNDPQHRAQARCYRGFIGDLRRLPPNMVVVLIILSCFAPASQRTFPLQPILRLHTSNLMLSPSDGSSASPPRPSASPRPSHGPQRWLLPATPSTAPASPADGAVALPRAGIPSAQENNSNAQPGFITKQMTANKQSGTNTIVTTGTAIKLTRGETVDI